MPIPKTLTVYRHGADVGFSKSGCVAPKPNPELTAVENGTAVRGGREAEDGKE